MWAFLGGKDSRFERQECYGIRKPTWNHNVRSKESNASWSGVVCRVDRWPTTKLWGTQCIAPTTFCCNVTLLLLWSCQDKGESSDCCRN